MKQTPIEAGMEHYLHAPNESIIEIVKEALAKTEREAGKSNAAWLESYIDKLRQSNDMFRMSNDELGDDIMESFRDYVEEGEN